MITEVAYASGVVTAILLFALHFAYNRKRAVAFPVAELERLAKAKK
ncbi:MAG: hypothetical protein LRZ99_00200 [Desulfotomaculum sp.]|nr:hypothetical protein [Desulfotomaculum sp.]